MESSKIFKTININKIVAFLAFILIGLWFTYNFSYGERIQYHDGLGWDGELYAKIAQQNPIDVLKSDSIPIYYIQRLLPSFIAHSIGMFLKFDLTQSIKLIQAFYIYNCFLLLAGLYVLFLIGRYFKWTLSSYFIGISLVFINYPIIKYSTYNPTLTDITAFTLGIFTFYFFLTNRIVLLTTTALISAFVFPLMQLAASFLILFRCQNFIVKNQPPTKWANTLGFILGLFVTALAVCLYYYSSVRIPYNVAQLHQNIIVISATCLFLYIFFCYRRIFDYLYFSKIIKKSIDSQSFLLRFLLVIIFYVAVKYLIFWLSNTEPGPLQPFNYITLILQATIVRPWTSMVAHITCYGPGLLLIIFLWNDFITLVKEKGLGLLFFICLFVTFGIGPESRQFINAWPVFAILICEILNRKKVSWFFTYSIVILSLIMSRFWLPMNVGLWTDELLKLDDGLLRFPLQMLFMGSGPWMSDIMYCVFSAVIIVVSVALLALLKLEKYRINK
ncbi:MAG: hypothetical protein ACYCQI_03625 [Gammaproteobacteria bacterium]